MLFVGNPVGAQFRAGGPRSDLEVSSKPETEKEKWGVMQDYLAQIEKLRKDAAECARIRDLATDQAKRQVFDRLANHLTVLADQVEMAMLECKRAGG
jgi:hypothetical protein